MDTWTSTAVDALRCTVDSLLDLEEVCLLKVLVSVFRILIVVAETKHEPCISLLLFNSPYYLWFVYLAAMWLSALGPFAIHQIPRRSDSFLDRTPRQPLPSHGSLGASFLVRHQTLLNHKNGFTRIVIHIKLIMLYRCRVSTVVKDKIRVFLSFNIETF